MSMALLTQAQRGACARNHVSVWRLKKEDSPAQRRRAPLPSCGLTQFSHRERVNTILRDGCRFGVRYKAGALDKAGTLALEL